MNKQVKKTNKQKNPPQIKKKTTTTEPHNICRLENFLAKYHCELYFLCSGFIVEC